ncbi:hypothetical protein pb186bvf_007011 [Paramecium bursaria]
MDEHYRGFQSAFLEFRMQNEAINRSGLLESEEIKPILIERGIDTSTKDMRKEDNYQQHKHSSRSSHIYPNYISDPLQKQKVEKFSDMYEQRIHVEELEDVYNTSLKSGLTNLEAQRRLEGGENRITPQQTHFPIREVFNYFTFALIIPIVLSIIGFFLNDKEHYSFTIETTGLTVILVVTHTITYQNFKKKKFIFNEYNQLIGQDQCMVMRDGVKQIIQSNNLVVGDLIEITQNAKIPADCRIVLSKELRVDNSLFTGESEPILLDSQTSQLPILDARNVAFFGAGCVYGEGKAIVIRTGDQTLCGVLAKNLRKPQSKGKLDIQIEKLGWYYFMYTITLMIVVAIRIIIFRYDNLLFLINSLIVAILSIIPISLMLILSISKKRMELILQNKNIILKDISIVEKIFEMDILMINKQVLQAKRQSVVQIIDEQPSTNKAIYFCTINKRNILENILNQYIKEEFKEKVIVQKHFTQMERYSICIIWVETHYEVLMIGAPELVLAKCNQIEKLEKLDNFAKKGISLISVAYRKIYNEYGYEFNIQNQDSFNFPFINFEYLGTILLENHISHYGKTLIKKIQMMGVKPIFISGDLPYTAERIATQADILQNPEMLTGEDIDNFKIEDTPEDEQESISFQLCKNDNVIYSRINPAQKLMVIQAYQKLGKIVGFVGYDATDAPSLSKCDVGFAFLSSNDLPKQSARVVLVDPNIQDLEQIHQCILQGRRLISNIYKQIKFLIYSKFGQMFTTLLMIYLGIPLPLTSWGIIFITIALDIIVIGLIYEREEVDMRIPTCRQPIKCLKSFLNFTILSSSSGLICYFFILAYLGYSPTGLANIIYQQAFSNYDEANNRYYSYNQSDPYLGNQNLKLDNLEEDLNPFIQHQFYKHLDNPSYFDFRNSIVKNVSGIYKTNIIQSDSKVCHNNNSYCYTILSLDIAQIGFIFGYIFWGWLQIYFMRSKLSPRYQYPNYILRWLYLASGIWCLILYIFYVSQYFPDIYILALFGFPSVPFLIITYILGEFIKK